MSRRLKKKPPGADPGSVNADTAKSIDVGRTYLTRLQPATTPMGRAAAPNTTKAVGSKVLGGNDGQVEWLRNHRRLGLGMATTGAA